MIAIIDDFNFASVSRGKGGKRSCIDQNEFIRILISTSDSNGKKRNEMTFSFRSTFISEFGWQDVKKAKIGYSDSQNLIAIIASDDGHTISTKPTSTRRTLKLQTSKLTKKQFRDTGAVSITKERILKKSKDFLLISLDDDQIKELLV